MASAEIVTLTGVPVSKNTNPEAPAAEIVTNAFYTKRSIVRHEEGVTEVSSDLKLAQSGLATAIEKRTGSYDETTTKILQRSSEVQDDLSKLDKQMVGATKGLANAQTVESEALSAESECKGSVIKTTAKPLRDAGDELFYRVETGETGDIESLLREEYERLGQLLGISQPENSTLTANTETTPSIAAQLQALDIAIENLLAATSDRLEKESTLKKRQKLETSIVEATMPILQDMSDHERAMKHFANILDRLTVIADLDETTLQKIKAILVTLWLVLSEPRSKDNSEAAYLQYKQAASGIELESDTCKEIEQ